MTTTNQWNSDYVRAQKATLDSIPADAVAQVVAKLRDAWQNDRQVFIFGNGGSAANASHFATDLGKGSSDKLGKRFRVLSLNDNDMPNSATQQSMISSTVGRRLTNPTTWATLELRAP